MNDRFRMLPSYHYEDNTDGVLAKSVGKPLRDYKIEGNCFQDGTPSPDNPIDIQCCGERTVNLLPYPYYQINTTNNGIAFTYGDDGSICMNGTCTRAFSTYLFMDKEKLIPGVKTGDTIILSKNANDEAQAKTVWLMCNYYDSSGTMKQGIANAQYLTMSGIISEEWVGIGCYIHVPINTTLNNLIFKPQIELGNTATPYEPYGYKVPVTVGGKNILPVNDFKGTVNWQSFPVVHIKVEPNTRYYFEAQYAKRLSNSTGPLSVYFYDNEGLSSPIRTTGLMLANQNDLNYLHQTSIDTGDYTDLYMMIRDTSGGSTTFEVKGMQLTKDYSPPYEPYIEPQTYNIYLDEPLRKVGDYADYVDFKNGKVVRELTTVQFTGGETWIDYTGNKTNTYQTRSTKGYMLKGLCNYYPVMSSKEIGTKNGTYVGYTGTHIITDLNCNTVDELKAFLKNAYDSGTPVTHIVKIRDTIFEQTVDLPQILTEKYTNIISVGTTLQPSKVNYQYYKGGK